jgi:hypothetical protein
MTSLFPWREVDPAALRAAAWIASCVGRGETAPLRRDDLAVLAADLELRPVEPGQVIFAAGQAPKGVWIVRSGLVELAVGSGRRRAVVQLLRPGDVDGDIQLLLAMAPPYTARAMEDSDCLFLSAPRLSGCCTLPPSCPPGSWPTCSTSTSTPPTAGSRPPAATGATTSPNAAAAAIPPDVGPTSRTELDATDFACSSDPGDGRDPARVFRPLG